MKKNRMKTMKNISKLLVFLIAVSICFTSCMPSEAPQSVESLQTIEDKGLEYGFRHALNCYDGTFCAYRSEKSIFDITDVTLDFFFGGVFTSNIEHHRANIASYPYLEICFKHEGGELFVVKRIEENFVSEKYRCNLVNDDSVANDNPEVNYCIVSYNYSETLTIPSEIFTEETGTIYFSLYGANARSDNQQIECIASINICYKVEGNKVFLSDKSFE